MCLIDPRMYQTFLKVLVRPALDTKHLYWLQWFRAPFNIWVILLLQMKFESGPCQHVMHNWEIYVWTCMGMTLRSVWILVAKCSCSAEHLELSRTNAWSRFSKLEIVFFIYFGIGVMVIFAAANVNERQHMTSHFRPGGDGALAFTKPDLHYKSMQ